MKHVGVGWREAETFGNNQERTCHDRESHSRSKLIKISKGKTVI